MKLLLAIIARLLFYFLEIFFILYSFIRILIVNKLSFKERINILNNYFYRIAISLDQHFNVIADFFLNDTLSNSKDTYFGNEDETISLAIAKLEKDNKLTKFGKFWAWFLNFVDKDHLKKSLENNL